MSDTITDKILNSFDNTDDLKEYASSQYKTIIAQSKKITELEKKLESAETKLATVEQKLSITSALSVEQQEGQTDTEVACVVQIAMLKGLAMNRELTLEEVKKLEIFAKTMLMIKGKIGTESEKRRDSGAKLTTEQLLALASSLSNTEQ